MVPPPPRPGKGDNGVITKLPDIPFTMEKPVPEDLDKYIKNPGLPRANLSCDKEHPEGTYSPPRNLTVMQQHIAFWDRDHDGVIYPHDTFIGFRRLGFNLAICLASVPIIHGTFAWWSQDNWLPNPMFPILVKNIHRGKHGSDSEVYDTEGRFVPEKFEEIWSKYDKGNKGALTKHEIWTMIKGQRNIMDPVGWTAGVGVFTKDLVGSFEFDDHTLEMGDDVLNRNALENQAQQTVVKFCGVREDVFCSLKWPWIGLSFHPSIHRCLLAFNATF